MTIDLLCSVKLKRFLRRAVQHPNTAAPYEPVLPCSSSETIVTMEVPVDEVRIPWQSWDAFTVMLVCLSPRQWYIPPITALCACSLSGRRTCSLWLVSTSSVAAVGSSIVQCSSRMVLESVSSRWIWCWVCVCHVGHSDADWLNWSKTSQ